MNPQLSRKEKKMDGDMQCMKCKEWFNSCRCWKSEGYIPKIWYCERCYGYQEAEQDFLKDEIEFLKLQENSSIVECAILRNERLQRLLELKSTIKQEKTE